MPIADDSWDNTLAIPRPQLEAPPRRTGRYRWVIAAASLGAIAILVALTVAPAPGFVSSGPDSPAHSSTKDGAQPAGPGMAALHSMPASPSDTPSDGRTGDRPTGAAPPFSDEGSGSSGSGSGSEGSSGPPPTTAGSTPPPPMVTVEAETGIRSGSAVVTSDQLASGGAYVGGIGDWGGSSGSGTLVLPSVDLPTSGTWHLTIYFLDVGPKGPRHATVLVSGASPTDLLFAGPVICCGTRTLDVSLSAGSHSVTITAPGDMGPSIDRLTFTLLPSA